MLFELNLCIEYKSNRSNFIDESFRRFNYENLDENKISNLNKLVLKNDESSTQIRDELRRSDDQSAISIISRKTSQITSNSKTIKRKNIENDSSDNQNNKSNVQRVNMMTLIVRTKASSSSNKRLVFTINDDVSQEQIAFVSFTTRKHHEISKKTFRLVKKNKLLSREAICAVVLRNIDIVVSLMKFRTILEILQESDQFAQKKRFHAVTSISRNAKFTENLNDNRTNNS